MLLKVLQIFIMLKFYNLKILNLQSSLFSSKTEIIINESDTDDVFQSIYSIYTTVISYIQKSLGQGSSWIADSVIDHTISIFKV